MESLKDESLKHESKDAKIKKYLDQMTEQERKAYLIALSHLGTSFNIYKSNGYIEWCKKMGL